MFGMRSVYRSGTIFALLPKTRSLRTGDSIWIKFVKVTPAIKKRISAEPRIVPPHKHKRAQWYTLMHVAAEDYAFVIEWLAVAYKAAR